MSKEKEQLTRFFKPLHSKKVEVYFQFLINRLAKDFNNENEIKNFLKMTETLAAHPISFIDAVLEEFNKLAVKLLTQKEHNDTRRKIAAWIVTLEFQRNYYAASEKEIGFFEEGTKKRKAAEPVDDMEAHSPKKPKGPK